MSGPAAARNQSSDPGPGAGAVDASGADEGEVPTGAERSFVAVAVVAEPVVADDDSGPEEAADDGDDSDDDDDCDDSEDEDDCDDSDDEDVDWPGEEVSPVGGADEVGGVVVVVGGDEEEEGEEGQGEGVTPPLGAGAPVPDAHGTGDEGDADEEAEGGGGGGVGLSCCPVSPSCRANQLSSWGSYTTKTFTTVAEGATTTTWLDW